MVPFQNRLTAMPNLSIKNVPESVVERLRTRARHHHRSLQGELLALVTEATRTARPASSEAPEPGGVEIESIAAEHRQRWQKPFSTGPSAAELIRAERDAR